MDAEAMDASGSDPSGSSSDSDSDSVVDMDPSDMQQLMQLEADLKANPYVYDIHLQYVALLRKCKLHARAREARQAMHKLFPLNEQLWIEWIEDEMEAVKSPADLEHISHLYAAAVKDYLSVNIWSAYLQFLTHVDPTCSSKTPEGAAAFRKVAEDAIQACGLHVSAGAAVWHDARQYEAEVAAGGGQEGAKALERVRQLYQRQLQVPLEGNDKLMKEYEAWEAEHKGVVPAGVVERATKAVHGVQLRARYEAAVAGDKPADAVMLAAYMAYLKLEEEHGDPARVQVLFERAVAAFPVTAELWLQYLAYLEHTLKITSLVTQVSTRAVHNCPWVGALWARALRAAERARCPPEQHEALYNRALGAGLQGPEDYMEVLLARADYLRRQAAPQPSSADAPAAAAVDSNGLPSSAGQALRAHFAAAVELMGSNFPEYLDRTFRLPGYWAHCEAQVLGDVGAGEGVWEEVLKGPLGRYCDAWCSYAAWQRALRRLGAARRVYSRGHGRKLVEGGQLVLCYDWLRFEREEGSAEELYAAHAKVDPIIEEASAAAAASNAQVLAVAQAAAQQAPKLSREEVAAMRRAHDPHFKKPKDKPNKKRAADAVDDAAPKRSRQGDHVPSSPPAASAPAAAEQQPAAEAAAAAAGPPDEHMEDAGPGPSSSSHPGAPPAAGGGDAGPPRPVYTDEHTVFIKGMGHDVHKPDLEKLFADIGHIKAIRMKKDKFTGQPKGFAYVEFESDEAMQAAVALDGTTVNGRTLFIAKSAPPGPGGRGGGGDGGGGRGRGGFGRGGPPFRGGGRGGRLAHVPVSAGHGNMGHPRGHLQLDDQPRGVHMPALVPRSMAVGDRGRGRGRPGLGAGRGATGEPKQQQRQHLDVGGGDQQQQQQQQPGGGGNAGEGGGAANGAAPKSNDEFRKMFLSGGKL